MKLKIQNFLKFAARFVQTSLDVSMFASLLSVVLSVLSWAMTGQLNLYAVGVAGWNCAELFVVRTFLKRWRPKIV